MGSGAARSGFRAGISASGDGGEDVEEEEEEKEEEEEEGCVTESFDAIRTTEA